MYCTAIPILWKLAPTSFINKISTACVFCSIERMVLGGYTMLHMSQIMVTLWQPSCITFIPHPQNWKSENPCALTRLQAVPAKHFLMNLVVRALPAWMGGQTLWLYSHSSRVATKHFFTINYSLVTRKTGHSAPSILPPLSAHNSLNGTNASSQLSAMRSGMSSWSH